MGEDAEVPLVAFPKFPLKLYPQTCQLELTTRRARTIRAPTKAKTLLDARELADRIASQEEKTLRKLLREEEVCSVFPVMVSMYRSEILSKS